jgi:hypothetical protein
MRKISKVIAISFEAGFENNKFVNGELFYASVLYPTQGLEVYIWVTRGEG